VGAAAEVDLKAGPGQADRQAGSPGAGADDRRAADRGQAAEPLPLEHHQRPDPFGDGADQRGRGVLDAGEAKRAPGADADLVRPDPDSAADSLGADHRHGHHRGAGLQGDPAHTPLGLAERARADPRALDEDQHDPPARQNRLGGLDRLLVAGAALDREGAERAEDPGQPAEAEQLGLGHVVHRAPGHRGDHERVQEAAVVGGDDHRSLSGDVLAPDPDVAEVDVEDRLERRWGEPVQEPVGALFSCAPVQPFLIHRTLAYPFGRRPLQLDLLSPGIERTRTLRGAVCGAVAAAVWALQQPLDKLVFSSRYDDVELLGKVVTRGDGWFPVGLALHMQNGALFGAVYANLLPELSGNRRAFAQATWRHLLFGIVLGELERRVNAEPEPTPPEPEAVYSSNGHGTLEH